MTPALTLTQAPAAQRLQPDANPLQKLALGLCMAHLIIYFSRFFDQFGGGFHLPGIVLFLMIIASVVAGRITIGFGNRSARFLLAFVGWASVTMIFSIWRYNSLPSYQALLLSLVYVAAISGLASNLRQVRQIMASLAASFLIAALLSFVFSVSRGGRLQLEIGNYHDPNQYALCLLMGIPLWWYLSASAQSAGAKIFCLGCTLPMFWVFFRTGSRGGLLGLITVIGIEFIRASVTKKVMLVVICSVSAVIVLATMPSYIKTRYMTFFDSSDVDLRNQTDEVSFLLKADMDSAAGRKALLLKSIDITLEHPIFGVGPGNFPTAVLTYEEAHEHHYAWFGTHNAYTEVSSETGIPGLLFFVLFIVFSITNLRRILRITGPRGQMPWLEMWTAARYLMLSLVGASITIFFLSVGFTSEIYVLCAVSIALDRVLRAEMAKLAPAPSAPLISAGFSRAVKPQLAQPQWVRPQRS